MANYTGVRCPVCSKKFSSTDDIVVCPVCGAPHHRACYSEQGACAFVEDHLSGKEWAPPPGEAPSGADGPGADGYTASGEGTKTCPSCGGVNPAENVFCQSCGHRLFAQEQRTGPGPGAPGMGGYGFPPGMTIDPVSMAYGGLRPEEEIDGVPVRDLAVFVGPNAAYYLPRFAAIGSGRVSFLPNFAAFFANFLYFFYRKMYLIGAALLAIFLVCMVPTFLYVREMLPYTLNQMGFNIDPIVNEQAAEYFANWMNIASIVRFVCAIAGALFANRLYFSRVMRTVRAMRDEQGVTTDLAYREALTLRGGVNRMLTIVVAATAVAAFFAVSSYLTQSVMLL